MVVGLVACKTQPPEEQAPSGPSLYLELAALNGGAVSKARVRLSSGEERQTTEQGTVLLDQLPVGRQALLVQAEGFSSTVLAFDMDQDVRAGARLQLMPLGEPHPFDASMGTSLPIGGMQLTVPPGALRDAQGNPIQGEVEAYLSALDLDHGELLAAPGLLEGVPVPGAEPVGLESLGIVSLVFQQNGRVIPFARGTHIGGHLPGRPGSAGDPDGRPGTRRSALSSADTYPPVPIWRLDAESGRWVPTDDQAVVTGSRWEATLNNTPSLFNVALPFWWRSPEANPGKPLQAPTPRWVGTVCLEVKVEDEKGQPVAGRMVVAQGVEYKGLTRGMTDAGGQVRLEVMRGQSVKVDAAEQAIPVFTDSGAGTCSGEGAPPMSITLKVAAPLCTPGTASDCAYSGPTQGICRAARKTCDAQGSAWSACEGEAGPQKERCDNSVDDDCDGTVNESCKRLCQEGETQSCYEGPEGTENVGMCRGGTRTCVAGGTAWSACEGQVLPAAEDYTRPEDEDCDGRTGMCLPDVSQPCDYTGPVGTKDVGLCRAGTKTCNGTGTDWNVCTGEVLPAPENYVQPEDEDCNGTAEVCASGSSQPCAYTGPAGTEDVGICHAGTQTCNGTGTAWNACTGEVLPAPENYVQPEDEDCNGTAEVCASGSSRPCAYTGPSGTEDVGICHAGTQTCNGTGTAWSACTGEVTPQSESCTSALDEDCDGLRNESPCGWVPTTSMDTTRNHPAAVKLNNGHVLVMGGFNSSGTALDTAVVYDPAALTWTPAGNMKSKRAHMGAVLLSDGRVLAVGGWDGTGRTNTAEVYDPGTQTWTLVQAMSSGREFHTVTALSNGKVLVTGGAGASGKLDTAEVYDPGANTWTSTSTAMGSARTMHTATRLNDGRVLVTGGHDNTNTRLTLTQLYDPATNAWTTVDAMNTARTAHRATLLSNGQVLISGGAGVSTHALDSEVYDPAADSWTTKGNLTKARDEHGTVLLSNGHVLVTGGDSEGTSTATVEVYDPGAGTWTTTSAAMNAARTAHAMVPLNTGELLVIGGSSTDSDSGALSTAEVYNPMPEARFSP
ncbi:hypothetical protein BO221_39415 [Archangium sp. Cb G35]|nr:hypothetical protein BO221_39415 [Archangium sp. Cb G35]